MDSGHFLTNAMWVKLNNFDVQYDYSTYTWLWFMIYTAKNAKGQEFMFVSMLNVFVKLIKHQL